MKTQVLRPLYSKLLIFFCKITPPPLSLNFDSDDFKGTGHKFNVCFKCCIFADNWFFSLFSPLFHLYHALATGFIFEFCLKLFGSNCTSLSCSKTPKNANIYFNLCSFSTYLMETTSLGQKALKRGSTLNLNGFSVKIFFYIRY